MKADLDDYLDFIKGIIQVIALLLFTAIIAGIAGFCIAVGVHFALHFLK